MIRRLKILLTSLALLLCLAPAVPVAAAPATGTDVFHDVCQNPDASQEVKNSAACQANGSDPITGKSGLLYKVDRILALVAGIAAVIMIIIGGLMYVTASGDAGKAKTARTVIVSAAIGLVVIAISQLFIAFVISIVD